MIKAYKFTHGYDGDIDGCDDVGHDGWPDFIMYEDFEKALKEAFEQGHQYGWTYARGDTHIEEGQYDDPDSIPLHIERTFKTFMIRYEG